MSIVNRIILSPRCAADRTAGVRTGCTRFVLGFALATVFASASARSGDWPRYRGLNGDGTTTESIDSWPPVEIWRASIGQGFSGVTVSGGHVYAAGWSSGTNQTTVYCFNEASVGNDPTPEWTYTIDVTSTGDGGYNGSRATPTVDGGYVWFFHRRGQIHCINASTGAARSGWPVDLGTAGIPGWNYASSVLIEGDLAIVNKGTHGTAVTISTHTVAWGNDGSGGDSAGYATPIAFTDGSQRTVVVYAGSNVSGVDPATGTILWYFAWGQGMADPIIYNDRVWAARDYGDGGATVRQLGSGALTAVWGTSPNTIMRNKENCSVFYNGYVYGIDGTGGAADLKCVDFNTGDVEWSQSGFGTESALIIAGTELVIMAGITGSSPANGTLTVAQATPSGYVEEHVQADILGLGPGSWTWTAPTLANGKLYLRSHSGLLVCYNVTSAPVDPSITIASNPTGRTVTVDASDHTAPYTFTSPTSTTHTVTVATPQSGGTGTRYVFDSWSANANFADPTYTVPASNDTLTANFTTQHQLGVSVTPGAAGYLNQTDNSWHDAGTVLTVSATAYGGYVFDAWSGALSGRVATGQSLTMSAPRDITATFQPDADGDGIGDTWENTYFGNLTTATATSDFDADGVSDLVEYQGATDPTVNNTPVSSGTSGLSCTAGGTAGRLALLLVLAGALLAFGRRVATA